MASAASSDTDHPEQLREGRRETTVAFVEFVGYATRMAEDERRTHEEWMGLVEDVIRPLLREHRGTIGRSTGNELLLEFPNARDAVKWARSVQDSMNASPHAGDRSAAIALRIAIHRGDVIVTHGDIYGKNVTITAGLQELAAPGGIVLTDVVYDLAHDALGGPARDLGFVELKNLHQPLRAYALDPPPRISALPARPRRGPLPSIAVLPLQNLGSDPSDDYFADGVVEDIIVSLSGLHELMVIARASTLMYRGREPDPREVGRNLGVRYVLRGSVRRSGSQVRVATELCDTYTGINLWGDRTEVPIGELFEVQDRIVSQIVAGIAPNVRITELQDAMRKRPESFTAYDYTLRALDIMNDLDVVKFMQARDFLTRAMNDDPGFAMPVAWAARWHSLLIGQGWSKDRDADAARGVALASRAIELDPHNAVALATFAHLKAFLFHDCDTALAYFERALDVSPNSALAWLLSSATLCYVARGEQAVRHAEHALWLSPFDQSVFVYYMFLGMAHYVSGSYEEALKWARQSQSENPLYTSNLRLLAVTLAALDRSGEAAEAVKSLLAREPNFTLTGYERQGAPFRDAEIRARVLAHLRKAGIPE